MKYPLIKLLIILLLLPLTLFAQAKVKPEYPLIQQTLKNMQLSWNKCNLKTFMHGYENSSNTLYISKNGIVKGYQAIAAHYQKNYHGCTEMGKISLSIIDFFPISPTNILVVGRYKLNRNVNHHVQKLGGVYGLIFRKNNNSWHIIVDHSS